MPAARPALADLAAAVYGHPSRHLRLVGVTGTDGKTSTTRLLAAILEQAGQRTGWLTTVDVKSGDTIRPNDLHHTTPEADRVQEVLAEMVAGPRRDRPSWRSARTRWRSIGCAAARSIWPSSPTFARST